MASMWTEYRDGKPVAYRYGDDNAGLMLFIEGGYPTEEEAKAAWEKEQAHKIPRDQMEDAALYE